MPKPFPISYRTEIKWPLLKRIFLLAFLLIPLGMIGEASLSTYIFIDKGTNLKTITALLILVCHFIATFLFFTIVGIPAMIEDSNTAKAPLFKLTFIVSVAILIIAPGMTLLFFPSSLVALIIRYSLYALLLPLLWLPISFFAVPLIIVKKLNVMMALRQAYLIAFRHWKAVLLSYFVLTITSILGLGILFLMEEIIFYFAPGVGIWLKIILSVFPFFALVIPLNPMWYGVGKQLFYTFTLCDDCPSSIK